jgi:hypothetical protein
LISFRRFRQSAKAFRFSFRHSRLKAVEAIRESVDGDGPEYSPIERFPVSKTTVRLVSNQELKGFENVKRRLETDGSRRDSIPVGRLGHEGADQIVGQNLCPNPLPNQLRRHMPHLLSWRVHPCHDHPPKGHE